MKAGGHLSIWFFIGISLAVNGALIFGAGIYQLIHPPENPLVLANLHPGAWWGAVLLLAGLVYCYNFSPSRERARNQNSR
jgi:hypothetical protein